MADAKKLTVRNPDGSIKIAGFVPLDACEELDPSDLARAWGGTWFDAHGQPQLATDPAWASALTWQKQLVDWYGYDNILKFYSTYTDKEFDASNAFETGKVAMVLRRRVAHQDDHERQVHGELRDGALSRRRRPSRATTAPAGSAARSPASRRPPSTPTRPGCS